MVSLLCFAGAFYFWRQGDLQREARKAAPPSAPGQHQAKPAFTTTTRPSGSTSLIPPAKSAASKATAKSRYPWRLSNTDKTTGQMLRSPKAIHLMNALLDTSKPVNNLAIPDKLRAPPNNGSYIVQANGPLDNNFRALLQSAGATIVSYVPNNAYLVQVSAAGAQQLQASAQSVLPFEPYYKLEPSLLNSVMTDSPLPASALKVTLFPGATASVLDSLNIHPMATEPSPFGLVVTVPASPGLVEAIAQMPAVQAVAPAYSKKIANDLARPRLGVSADSLATTSNYLGLSGSNILVNINDTGADSNHPDLMGRLYADSTNNLYDTDGHGTHVTGTILGNGSMSSTVTNASGSVTNASFRGMATNATAYELSYYASDSYLQGQAARSNAPISNNSWDNGDAAYDIESASYDAAVRDALPEVSGPQPLIFVFSAGNSGGGTQDGQNGSADSILSPGTAKNVITVGAIEQPRNITNSYVLDAQTNIGQPFLADTDTGDQVAWFSSRGNVGIGIEGANGRFKPDLVAPGTFVISCRSQEWDTNSYYNPTNVVESYYANQSVAPGGVANFLYPVPANPDQMIITVLPNSSSPTPFPAMPIYVALNQVPDTNTDFLGTNQVFLPTNALGLSLNYGDTVYFSVGNPTNVTVSFDLEVQVLETNADPYYEAALSNLNNNLSPGPPWWYRYESGTSMAAAGVSGMLACMEEFFNNTLKITNASPALMKALLINGARSLSSPGQPYDFQVATSLNLQGWGLPNLPNSIPPELTNYVTGGANTMPVLFFDQSPTNALATGQSSTTTLQLTPAAASQALRVTLVWTDPPGNPNVGIKLVNNLDLIVSNTATGDVYYGNDIPSGSIYNEVWNTNSPSPADMVNNVENVFLPPSTGTNFAIIVNGTSVNVNAVTLNTNNVVQDYALVISTGDAGGTAASPFANYSQPVTNALNNVSPVTTLNDGIPLLNQRIGANSQYASTTNGITNQWNFYVYTNTPSLTNSSFTNVAFITFFPPNLGVPRMEASGEIDPSDTNATRVGGADIDLYVSTDPALTNLDTNVISNAFAGINGAVSVNRNGNQVVTFANTAVGQVYYIGIKSEDQQGAQYGFAGVASDVPFNQMDSNGNTVVTMHVLPANIPGGSASSPQYSLIFGVSTLTTLIRNATVTENVTAQNFGDYIGTLSHNGVYATLNNHTYFTNANDTNETFIYDDSGEGNTPGSRTSDGPGNLRSYFGTSAVGSWIFTMVNDSSPTDLGQINSFQITLEPQPPTNGVTRTLLGSAWFYDFIDVPANCTNLTITVVDNSANAAPLELLVKYGAFPTLTEYDKEAIINPPGGSISITPYDNPPLNPGRYYFAIYNPNVAAVTFTNYVSLGLTATGNTGVQYLSVGGEPIPDDAVMYSTINVGANTPVVSASVGVRIDHPRVSDLVLTLISPEGTRVLLAENRGGSTTNYGSGINTTNVLPSEHSGTAFGSTNSIALTNGQTAGTLVINYDFYTVPDDMRIYYAGTRIFDSGLINGSGTFSVNFGPGAATNVDIVMNEPGTNPATNDSDLWEYSASVITVAINYATFTEDTNLTTLPIKFAVPPFASGPAYTSPVTIMTSGFEGFTNGLYNSVDGWTTMDANPVTVANVPALANSGTNVLALHQGSITRVLPTVAGATYTLNFAAHGRPYLTPVSPPYMVSWWKGESNMADTITASGNGGYWSGAGQDTYTNGLVGDAFVFPGPFAPGAVEVPDAPDLEFTSSMTAEAWIYPTNISFGTSYSILSKFDIPGYVSGFDAYSLGIESTNGDGLMQISADGVDITGSVITSNAIPANQWTHIASTYDGTNLSIYFNGILQGTSIPVQEGIDPGNNPLGIGGAFGGAPQNADYPPGNPFSGLIDEATVYTDPLTPLQIQDIYAAGSAGKVGPVNDSNSVTVTLNLVGALSTNFSASDTWSNYSITFMATSNNMVLQVMPGSDGVLLDSFTLVQNAQASSNNYYLPEESLAKVTGENAQGPWQLEVLDNRAGPPSPNPTPILVSWELNLLTDITTPTAIPLTFGIAQSNIVQPGFISYYVVNVPPWAHYATNMLFNVLGGQVSLLFNQSYEPGTSPSGGDYTLLPTGTGGVATLVTNGTPPLIPGQQYYLGVQNTGTTAVSFSIEVTFDIPVLTNMVPVTNSLAASTIPQYYQFNVTNGGFAAAFQLFNLTGNVSLVASYGAPLPTLAANAYSASYFGSNETILVFSNSTPPPVPLTPGTWYLGVFNNDVTTQTYTIMASEYGPPNIIPLTNGVPFTTNFPPGAALGTFFSFNITDNPVSAVFELYNLSGNVDLTVDRGPGNYPYGPPAPSGSPYFAASYNPGTNDEQILVRTNTALNGTAYTTNLNDTWYFGVPNDQTYNVTFTILAEETTNGLLSNGVPTTVSIQHSSNGLTFTWPSVPGQTYELVGTTNLLIPMSNWTVLATNSNAPPNIDTYFYSNTNTNGVAPFMFFNIWQIPTF